MKVRRERPETLAEKGERRSEGRRRTRSYVEVPRSEYSLRRQRIRARSRRFMDDPG